MEWKWHSFTINHVTAKFIAFLVDRFIILMKYAYLYRISLGKRNDSYG